MSNDKYLPEQLVRKIPNFLNKYVGATASYICMLEFSKQGIQPDDDSEFAHLNTKQAKILQYIGASEGHEFLLNETLQPSAFTYKLFEKLEDGSDPE